MDNSILQEALALPADDRLELAERIRESLVAGGSAREPGECPRCGCSHVARRGRDADVCTVKSQSTISASGFRQILHEQRDPSPYSDLPSISAVSMR